MEALFSFLESITYLAICIAVVSGATGFLLYRRIRRFESLNRPPKISYIIPQEYTIKKGPAIPVKAGVFIEDFLDFKLLTNTFMADLRVWFMFNPSLIDLDTVGRFSFDKGEVFSQSKPETKFIGSQLFAQYKIRLRFSSDLDFHAFPIDDHRLYLLLKNEAKSPEEMVFDVSETGIGLSEKIYLSEWTIIDSGVEAGYQQEHLHKHIKATTTSFPCAVFFIDFCRKGIRKALIIILPIILIFFVGFSSMIFFYESDLHFLIAVNTGSITGLIAYRFVIESISPDVGYFTLTDYIFTLYLTFSFISFLITSFLMLSSYSDEIMRLIDTGFALLIPVALLCFQYWIIQTKGRKTC